MGPSSICHSHATLTARDPGANGHRGGTNPLHHGCSLPVLAAQVRPRQPPERSRTYTGQAAGFTATSQAPYTLGLGQRGGG